jgi:hypothetical protein
MKQVKHWLWIGLLSVTVAVPAHGSEREARSAEEKTIRGDVTTWTYVEHPGEHGLETMAEVTLDNEVILQEEKVDSIDIAWGQPRKPPYKMLLLAINQSYPRLCESLYRLVDLNKSKPPHVTARFGNCHADPVIHEQGEEVTFYFPRFHGKVEEAYRYTTQTGLKKIPVTSKIRTKEK